MKRRLAKVICSLGLAGAMLLGSWVPAFAADEASTKIVRSTEDSGVQEFQTGYRQPVIVDLGETDDVTVSSRKYQAYGASEWDQYGSSYYYERMNSSEKALYDRLYNECMKVLTTNVNLRNVGSTAVTDPVTYPGLSLTQASNIAMMFQLSNPQFYFINEYMMTGSSGGTEYIALGAYTQFESGATRASYTSRMKSTINSWVEQIKSEPTVIDMQLKAHDLVAENTEYASNTFDQGCYSVFIEGESVCAGYSEAYELLCNAVGIDTICVTSVEHEWNKSYVYGKWYVVDCTWDDQSEIIYDYFDTSDAYASYGNTYHTLESVWAGVDVPAADSDAWEDGFGNYSYVYDGVDYSAVFDIDDYLTKYSDVRSLFGADLNALLGHFVNYGMKEGRQGCSAFNVFAYANRYADLRAAYGTDLKAYYLHYINSGKKEGRDGTGNDTAITAAIPPANNSTPAVTGTTVYNGVDYSAVYNADYYFKHNTDLQTTIGANGDALIAHFVKYGMDEGRQAKENFNPVTYKNRYKDLRQAYGNCMGFYYLHYMKYGAREGRSGSGTAALTDYITKYNGVDYSAVYDYSYYIKKNPDIARFYGEDDLAVIQHFVMYGMDEGRQAKESFNPVTYKNRYKDLRQAYGNCMGFYYLHYMKYGAREGRSGSGTAALTDYITKYNGVDYSAVYDYSYYIAANPDVAKFYGEDDLAIIQHFVNYGMKEGRQASSEFNVRVYQANYADLRAAFGNDLKSYYLHYINSGKAEGRLAK